MKSCPSFLDVASHVRLATTERAIDEVSRRVGLGMRRPELLPALEQLALEMEVLGIEMTPSLAATAEAALRDAVASRNGATSDSHILALAWELGADIWSHDRDFAGTGVASWSTINLIRALAIKSASSDCSS